MLICEMAVTFLTWVCSEEPMRIISKRLVMNSAFYKWVLKIIKTFMDLNRLQKHHGNK